jgi:hypothetical protein
VERHRRGKDAHTLTAFVRAERSSPQRSSEIVRLYEVKHPNGPSGNGEGDVGGFGIGSEVTTQVYGALGYQITPRINAEAGYRFLYMDYNTTALIYQVAMHGAQISMSFSF